MSQTTDPGPATPYLAGEPEPITADDARLAAIVIDTIRGLFDRRGESLMSAGVRARFAGLSPRDTRSDRLLIAEAAAVGRAVRDAVAPEYEALQRLEEAVRDMDEGLVFEALAELDGQPRRGAADANR